MLCTSTLLMLTNRPKAQTVACMPLLMLLGYAVVKMYVPKYDMMVMRQHLLKCLESGRMTAFPSSDRENHHIVANKMIKVRCYCRLPDSGVMIQCSSCKEWFHKKCDSSIPRKAWSDLKFKWHCKMCQSVPLIN